MSESLRVLIIDDDKISRKMIARSIESVYSTEIAANGEEGLSRAVANPPNAILLDVEMPGLNGYEVCDRIRHNDALRSTPVIFLSGHSSMRERFLGLEAGADDYLVKPCTKDDLLTKLAYLIHSREREGHLHQQMLEARQVASVAIAGSSEMAIVNSFVSSIYSTKDLRTVAARLFHSLATFDLHAVLLIRAPDQALVITSHGTLKPLERELLLRVTSSSRFLDFGCRTIVSYPNVVILIKNMPLQDRGLYGRIKDLVPFMLEAIDSKVASVNAEKRLLQQASDNVAAFQALNQTVHDLLRDLQVAQEKSAKIASGMLQELTDKLVTLGLDDDQERLVLDLVDSGAEAICSVINTTASGRAIDRILAEVQDRIEQQRNIIDSMGSGPQTPKEDMAEVTSSVELF